MIPKKRFILIIVTLVVICALLHRGYPLFGLVSTLVLIAVYVLSDVRRTVGYIINFKRISRNRQIKAVTAVVLVMVLLTGLFGGQIPYFFMLVMLATDYMLYDNQTSK